MIHFPPHYITPDEARINSLPEVFNKLGSEMVINKKKTIMDLFFIIFAIIVILIIGGALIVPIIGVIANVIIFTVGLIFSLFWAIFAYIYEKITGKQIELKNGKLRTFERRPKTTQ